MTMDRCENPFLATLRLPLTESRIITTGVISAHFFSLFVPWLIGLSLIFKIMLTVCPVLSLCHLFYKYRFPLAKERAAELILGSEDDWQIKMDNGLIHQAILGDSLFVHPLLTIILLKYDRHKKYFIFTPENIDADQFRRLRVRLRFKVDTGQ
jgi:hypothetical protein